MKVSLRVNSSVFVVKVPEIKPLIRIRSCATNDFASVLRLLRQLWPEKQLDESAVKRGFERALDSGSQACLCADNNNDQAVGFVSLTIKNNLWQAANLGHIDELIVDQAHHGHGLGSELLNAIIDVAKERHCTRIELDSAFHRKKAHQFYERNGFENRAYLFSKRLT